MDPVAAFQGADIYLIDQILRGFVKLFLLKIPTFTPLLTLAIQLRELGCKLTANLFHSGITHQP